MKTIKFSTLLLLLFLQSGLVLSQVTDTLPAAQEEEDYSQYENVTFTDAGAKRYCSPKIFDLSPQRFVSVGWDWQLGYTMQHSTPGAYQDGDDAFYSESADATYTGGLRLSANIPVVSRNSVVWQMGANFADTRFAFQEVEELFGSAGLIRALNANGLRTAGLNTTVFKPLGEKTFLLFQGSADLSGNYTFGNFQSLRYLRYSAAAIWGKRPNDRKQWGLGVARTYRVGEMNYIPIVMFNYTAPSRKWGTEILFPARAHVRRTFNPRNLMLLGYELEGQSYRNDELSNSAESWEIRRGELRTRVEYQRQLFGFVWLSVQAGWRYNWSYNVDTLPEGREFFRGFFGDQTYRMLGDIGNPLYFNIGVHLVSP